MTHQTHRPGAAECAPRVIEGMAAIWHNWATSASVKRCMITYDSGTDKESLGQRMG
jgi:hypothetical protein